MFVHLHHHQVDSLFLSNSQNPVCFKCHDVMSCIIIDLMIGNISLYIGIKIIKTTSRLKYSLSWNSKLKIYRCLLFRSFFSRAFPETKSWHVPTWTQVMQRGPVPFPVLPFNIISGEWPKLIVAWKVEKLSKATEARKKKKRPLHMKYWWFDRDPYVMVKGNNPI